jgi:hypothetical protein
MIIKAKAKTRNGLDIRRETITVAMVEEVTEKANRLNQALVPISMLVTRLRTLQQPPPANPPHIGGPGGRHTKLNYTRETR